MTIRHEQLESAFELREAMRHIAGGVSVITAGVGSERTGLTATSATSLSIDPPTMIICVNRAASAWPVILANRHFAVNVLAASHKDVAERFAGRGGLKGAARYSGAIWNEMGSGASGLHGALAVIDCAVEEVIERHTHGIIIGTVLSVVLGEDAVNDPLVYGRGHFTAVRFPAGGSTL